MVEASVTPSNPAAGRDPSHPKDGAAAELGTVGAAEHLALIAEVRMLADHIDATRREIAALAADEAVRSHVFAATDELDAVVMHTAEATGKILDVCEILDAADLPGSSHIVAAATARIYEACSFQDLTGQRVAKVVQTLRAIETKLAQILSVFGHAPSEEPTSASVHPPADPLLNGPQHPKKAMDQDAVDALLDAGR